MEGSESLISDLGVILLCAAVVTLVFKRLQLPVFLGYVVAGFLIGPNFLPQSPIHDLHTVHALSELGVVFLMFYIGMEFDIARLRQVFMPAFLAVVLQTVVLIFIGTQMAPLLGWDSIEGLFLGALLAISSSMITISVLQSNGLMHRPHAQLAIGILILEDILAVALLVILSGVAVSGHVDWLSLWKVTFAIAVFAVGVYVAGRLLSRRLMHLLERFEDPELVTICAVALMLGLGVLAISLHLSVALGAFLAGSILSQSRLSHRIEQLTEPLRNVFCAVFFVAAGMLIAPAEIIDQWWQIALLALLVVVAKVSTVWLGLFMGGQTPETAFRAAVVKSQIGEFSFIIAALAQSLNVAGSGIMSLAVGVSVISTILGILLTNKAGPSYHWLSGRVPAPLRTLAQFYRNFADDVQATLGRNMLWRLIRRPLVQILVFFLLLNAIVLSAYVIVHYIEGKPGEMQGWVPAVAWTLAAVCCLPLLTAILRNLNVVVLIIADSLFSGNAARHYMRGRLQNIVTTVSVVGLAIIVGGIYLSAAAAYLPRGVALGAFILLIVLALLFFWKRIIHVNSRLEYLFMQSFNQRAREEEKVREASALDEIAQKYPWPVHVKEFVVPALSMACGLQIAGLRLREKTGATVIAISRNGLVLYGPEPTSRIFPLDRLYLFGDEKQNHAAAQLFSQKRAETPNDFVNPDLTIEKIFIPKESIFADETLADVHLRKDYGVTVLGIQRGKHRITSPGPDDLLLPGDILMVIGNAHSIKKLQEDHPRRKTEPPREENILAEEA